MPRSPATWLLLSLALTGCDPQVLSTSPDPVDLGTFSWDAPPHAEVTLEPTRSAELVVQSLAGAALLQVVSVDRRLPATLVPGERLVVIIAPGDPAELALPLPEGRLEASLVASGRWRATGDPAGSPRREFEISIPVRLEPGCDLDADGVSALACGGADCADDEPLAGPGDEEVCGDGADNDCDGAAPGCGIAGTAPIGAVAANTVLGGDEGFPFGFQLATGDLSGDGTTGALVAPGWVGNSPHAYWFADPLGAGPTADSSDARISDPEVGWSGLTAGRDVTGDGFDDVLLGDSATQAVYLFAGPLEGQLSPEDALAVGWGPDGFGVTVAMLPDLDGDGIDDMAVHALGPSDGPSGVYVFPGGPDPTLAAHEAPMTLVGGVGGFGVGLLGVEDLSGDGAPELVVGAPRAEHGKVLVYSGFSEGTLTAADAWSTFSARESERAFAFDIDAVGDLDGDGLSELMTLGELLGADDTSQGAAWIWSPVEGRMDTRDALFRVVVGPSETFTAELVATVAGDSDGDGVDEIAISWASEGAARVGLWDLVLPPDGRDLLLSDARAVVTDLAVWGGGGLTPHLAALGDQDGDGFDDLLVGEPAHQDDGGTHDGAFHVLLGGPGF